MLKFLKFGLPLCFLTFVAVACFAGDFEDGVNAAKAGDYEKAYQLWMIDALKGDATSQYNIGVMNNAGQGVPQDYDKATKWYREAAEQGHQKAQYNLGVMYFNGHGVKQSYEKAYAWWLVASARGDEKAINHIKLVQKTLSPSQIEHARQIAKEISVRLEQQ